MRDLRGSGAHSVEAPLEVVDADVLQREQVLQLAHLRLQHLRAHEHLLNDAHAHRDTRVQVKAKSK